METRSTKYAATQGKWISPTDSENCATILDILQEDMLLKVKQIRSFRLSGGAAISQSPLTSSKDSEEEDGKLFWSFRPSGGLQSHKFH